MGVVLRFLMEFRDQLEKEYERLMNNDSGEFEISEEIKDEPSLIVTLIGKREDKEYYDEGKFSIDSIVKIEIDDNDKWDEVSGIVESVENTVRNVNISSIGLSSPVVVRIENDQKTKKWARRIIHEVEDNN